MIAFLGQIVPLPALGLDCVPHIFPFPGHSAVAAAAPGGHFDQGVHKLLLEHIILGLLSRDVDHLGNHGEILCQPGLVQDPPAVVVVPAVDVEQDGRFRREGRHVPQPVAGPLVRPGLPALHRHHVAAVLAEKAAVHGVEQLLAPEVPEVEGEFFACMARLLIQDLHTGGLPGEVGLLRRLLPAPVAEASDGVALAGVSVP